MIGKKTVHYAVSMDEVGKTKASAFEMFPHFPRYGDLYTMAKKYLSADSIDFKIYDQTENEILGSITTGGFQVVGKLKIEKIIT